MSAKLQNGKISIWWTRLEELIQRHPQYHSNYEMWKRMTIITKFQQLTNITCQGWCMMRRVGRGGSRRQKGSARPLGALLLFITLPVKILLLLGKGSLDGRYSLCCRFCLWSVHDDYNNDDGYFLVVMRICWWWKWWWWWRWLKLFRPTLSPMMSGWWHPVAPPILFFYFRQ